MPSARHGRGGEHSARGAERHASDDWGRPLPPGLRPSVGSARRNARTLSPAPAPGRSGPTGAAVHARKHTCSCSTCDPERKMATSGGSAPAETSVASEASSSERLTMHSTACTAHAHARSSADAAAAQQHTHGQHARDQRSGPLAAPALPARPDKEDSKGACGARGVCRARAEAASEAHLLLYRFDRRRAILEQRRNQPRLLQHGDGDLRVVAQVDHQA